MDPPPPVRDLVLRYGWNTTAYQILNPGIEHWRAPDAAAAVVGVVRQPGRWIAAGAPVCEEARRDEQVLGFLVASPVPLRGGYLFEQIVRCPSAPNGVSELLIDAAMRDLATRDCEYVTQGLVALSQQAADAIHDNPLWVRALF